MKPDCGKPRPTLLPGRALAEVAALLTAEAERHQDAPGRPGYLDHLAADYVDAAGRHWLALVAGDESEDHLVRLAASALIALELRARERTPCSP